MNMKKSFPEEKGTKKGIREFIDKKGFYIVLLLCIAVVAGTAVFVTTRNATSGKPGYDAKKIEDEPDEELVQDAALNESEKLDAQTPPDDKQASADAGQKSDIGSPASNIDSGDNSAAKPKEEQPGSTPKTPVAPGKSTTPKKSATPVKQQSFIMPVTGNITLEYAKDKLVYSKTLEEWRAHPGVDIASDRGTPVKAAADGVVCDISNEQYYGVTVVIDHGNDIKSLYRNLASDDVVSVNQKVKQGEIIGSVGNTAMDESSEQAHLHFEVLKKDVNADPMEYLPISAAG